MQKGFDHFFRPTYTGAKTQGYPKRSCGSLKGLRVWFPGIAHLKTEMWSTRLLVRGVEVEAA